MKIWNLLNGWILQQVSTLLILGCLSVAAWAEEETVSQELLEFLGEWSTETGEWIDPDSLEDEDKQNE